MSTHVKVSKRFQIAVPSEARRKLHINEGDRLLVEVRDGSVLLIPEPADYVQHMRGLHREIWTGVEPQAYVRQEREAWHP
jgi:AbrB family looped-hinge helix DNA binding protein